MPHDITIKELRENLADFADRVEKGESFRVIRRSKPSFILMNITEEEHDPQWETVIDFTDGGRKTGVPLEAALKTLRKISR